MSIPLHNYAPCNSEFEQILKYHTHTDRHKKIRHKTQDARRKTQDTEKEERKERDGLSDVAT
jgi:hypothetical protein